MQIINSGDRLSCKADQHIALSQSRALRRRAVHDLEDQQPALKGKVVVTHQTAMQGDSLSSHANVAASNPSIANQSRSDKLRRVRANREADALGAH